MQAIKHWSHYLVHRDFILFTDHDALRHLDSQAKFSSAVHIFYTPSIADLYPDDAFFGRLFRDATAGISAEYSFHDGFLFWELRLCVPDCSLRLKIIQELHNEGHVGRDIILQLVTSSYFWPSLCRDVERFIARCRVCQLSKGKASNAGLSTQDSVSSPLMAEVLAIRMALISAVNREIIHPNFFFLAMQRSLEKSTTTCRWKKSMVWDIHQISSVFSEFPSFIFLDLSTVMPTNWQKPL